MYSSVNTLILNEITELNENSFISALKMRPQYGMEHTMSIFKMRPLCKMRIHNCPFENEVTLRNDDQHRPINNKKLTQHVKHECKSSTCEEKQITGPNKDLLSVTQETKIKIDQLTSRLAHFRWSR
ncbi:hypothetical protein MAR_018125 [Mya arenaria]|uniref:Uncharacterized protein n=1 Tax=Mya arenaria TaxID=6604 RepID=A0ABY7EDS0_MYAAR|nr:hypothetical protein MAR_018125 [Mya arenaria]